ncbi:hypothetical protein AGMMS49944_30210 [Spirochaetia bacterium]|nr:hypothetical protein AGMMS49944_30210 [Spirochaetia bacterium]
MHLRAALKMNLRNIITPPTQQIVDTYLVSFPVLSNEFRGFLFCFGFIPSSSGVYVPDK